MFGFSPFGGFRIVLSLRRKTDLQTYIELGSEYMMPVTLKKKLCQYLRISQVCINWRNSNSHFISILALISVIYISSLFASAVSAQAFSPQFGVDLIDPSPGVNSSISLVFNVPAAGEQSFGKIVVTIPAGFEFSSFDQLNQNEKIGAGTFIAGLAADGTAAYNTTVSLLNDQNIAEGQKALWKLVFDDGSIPQIDIILTGDTTSSYSFSIEFPSSVSLPTPIFWGLEIFGTSSQSLTPIVKNPQKEGKYVWKAEFQPNSGETIIRETEVLVTPQKQVDLKEQKSQENKTTTQNVLSEKEKQGKELLATTAANPFFENAPAATSSTTVGSGFETRKPGGVPFIVPAIILAGLFFLGFLGFKVWKGRKQT